MITARSAPLRVFLSYSRQDEALREELEVHLAGLRREGRIELWQDRNIEAGQEWEAELQKSLETTQIFLLLVSPQFLASDAIWGRDLKRALQLHEAGTARVIPIILRPCDWQSTPFAKLQVLPRDGQPITFCSG